jgi:excisionase family DNA binding protein
MEDRLMTVKQVATYLNVNERTVLNLVSDGALPGFKVGNQWRFRKAMVDTWLDDQRLGVTPRYVESQLTGTPQRMLALASCFGPTHIVPELAGLAQKLGLVRDETWFVGALIQRENVLPSALGNGLAFLHTLRRSPEQVVKPFMVLGRSKEGVDFDALDGKPVHLFFVLGLKFDELHLPWLSKLVHMLAQPGEVDALLAAPDAQALFARLADAEHRLEHPSAGRA